ncbi:MAG: FAD-binding protein [Pyrinomonadaceae bacterium]|nr:FAD-binding protein [Phycisphaerales bacterium]
MRLPVLNNAAPVPPPLPPAMDDHARQAIASDIASRIKGVVRFGSHDRMLYSTDASLYQVEPLGVVIPSGIDDIEPVVGYCGEHGVALLPRGGGTSLAGQCTSRAVVLDASPNCRAIGPVQPDMTVWVEPGITIDELNRELLRRASNGTTPETLFFAPDPATTSQACIGGCIGNNSAGARSIRYGRTSENLAALDVVLSTGERVILERGAGRTSPVARRLGASIIDIARRNAGLIRERFPRTVRRNAGYGIDLILDQLESTAGATPEDVDLSGLLCGSEGTLAVTLRAKLKLRPLPSARGLAVLSFTTLEQAIDAVRPILDAGLPLGLSAVELLDDVVLDAAMGNLEYRKYVEMLPGGKAAALGGLKAVLYVEFFGFGRGTQASTQASPAQLDVQGGFESLRQLAQGLTGLLALETHTDAAAMLSAWKLRKAGEPLLHGLPGARKPLTFVEDNAVPVERLGEFVSEFKKIVGRHGTRAAYWAHASVGVLHVRPMIDLHDPADRVRMREIAVEVADLARACGGIMSGEHGDGRVRGPLLQRFFGPELMHAFREIKQAFDPAGILNPGNIVGAGPVESMTQNLRAFADLPADRVFSPVEMQTSGRDARSTDGESAHAHTHSSSDESHASRTDHHIDSVETYYDYSDQHGFRGAAEMCNGAGLCRKRAGGGGTMCPSYMATLDERHSTRGRGNALRLAITGQFSKEHAGSPQWDDTETINTLDLCLSCKACKSECPSNVDIARLKAEYTAQRYKQAGHIPLASLLIGHVRTLNQLGSLMPGLANFGATLAPVRAILNRVMGLHPDRSLPRFDHSLYSMMKRGIKGSRHQGIKERTTKVLLFADCFTTYNEPRIGLAAASAISRLGFDVDIIPKKSPGEVRGGCCGRSMISVGMLDAACREADATLAILARAADDPAVEAIVVCEPSCLSAIKDDWLSLKLTTDLATRKRVAAKAMLAEEFLATVIERDGLRSLLATRGTRPIMLHAHCHQKALWGAASSARLLELLAPGQVRVLDSGCCGMAGSFGYARHRFDLSNRIGELSLFPAVRAAVPGTIIAATGTSCRHQLHDATHVHALHPIQIADSLLQASLPASVD